jgi:hypothetical protein
MFTITRINQTCFALSLVALIPLLGGQAIQSQTAPHSAAKTVAAAAPRHVPQKTFATPQAAVKALIRAVKSKSNDEVFSVVGEEMRGSMTTDHPLLDQLNIRAFLQVAKKPHIKKDKGDKDRLIIAFGESEWPFPAPLVNSVGGWRFDGAAGREEVEDRRIGMNELVAIRACHVYVKAQKEYARTDRTHSGHLEFAQRVFSSPGKKDGLYWRDDDGNDPSPLGPLFAEAAAATARGERPKPLMGYRYKILTAQGNNAVGGARTYLTNGHMVGGFAMVAWPDEYGKTGVYTFIVNHSDKVYQRDFGGETERIVAIMTAFDPNDRWKVTKDNPDLGDD